jgi:hypothetical protein
MIQCHIIFVILITHYLLTVISDKIFFTDVLETMLNPNHQNKNSKTSKETIENFVEKNIEI